jgi:hypothetical protein
MKKRRLKATSTQNLTDVRLFTFPLGKYKKGALAQMPLPFQKAGGYGAFGVIPASSVYR